MWDSRINLRMQYATCQSLARRIDKFMAKQSSFDLPAWRADELNDMVAAMIDQLEEVEDLWSEVTQTARETGPYDPRDCPLLKDWANVVSVKRVVEATRPRSTGTLSQILAQENSTKTCHTSTMTAILRPMTTRPWMNSTIPRMDPCLRGLVSSLPTHRGARHVTPPGSDTYPKNAQHSVDAAAVAGRRDI